jgi:hypothetical protein
VFQEGAGGRAYRSPCISRRLTRQRRELEGTFFKAPGLAATGLAASIVRWLSFISGLRPFAVFGVLTLGLLKKKLDGIF